MLKYCLILNTHILPQHFSINKNLSIEYSKNPDTAYGMRVLISENIGIHTHILMAAARLERIVYIPEIDSFTVE